MTCGTAVLVGIRHLPGMGTHTARASSWQHKHGRIAEGMTLKEGYALVWCLSEGGTHRRAFATVPKYNYPLEQLISVLSSVQIVSNAFLRVKMTLEGFIHHRSPVMFTVSDFKNTQSKLTNMLTDLSCFKLYLVRQKRCHFLKIYSQVS